MTLASQANRPKVNKLIGSSKILINGTKIILASIKITVALARSTGLEPTEKEGISLETKIRAIKLIKKLRMIDRMLLKSYTYFT